jgi:hypothetical protein
MVLRDAIYLRFDYQQIRERAEPIDFRKKFKGLLQTEYLLPIAKLHLRLEFRYVKLTKKP